MDKKDIVFKLTKLFQTVFNDSQLVVTDQMTANDVAGWDSLSHMVLITEIEDLFEIQDRGIAHLFKKRGNTVSEEAKDLVRRLLHIDPQKRITAHDALR